MLCRLRRLHRLPSRPTARDALERERRLRERVVGARRGRVARLRRGRRAGRRRAGRRRGEGCRRARAERPEGAGALAMAFQRRRARRTAFVSDGVLVTEAAFAATAVPSSVVAAVAVVAAVVVDVAVAAFAAFAAARAAWPRTTRCGRPAACCCCGDCSAAGTCCASPRLSPPCEATRASCFSASVAAQSRPRICFPNSSTVELFFVVSPTASAGVLPGVRSLASSAPDAVTALAAGREAPAGGRARVFTVCEEACIFLPKFFVGCSVGYMAN